MILKLSVSVACKAIILYYLEMLTEEVARTLGFKRQFYYKINSPSFVSEAALWHKQKNAEKIPHNILHKKHVFSYSKKGRTFGFETKRYIEYWDGVFLYFQEENDKQYKGYCKTQNLYMYYFNIGPQFLLHLTNGNEWSQFYFNDNSFYNFVEQKLKKDVVQLNFIQKYSLMELLGKGTYSKVYLARNKHTDIKYAVKIVAKKDKNGSCTRNIVDEEKKIFRIIDCQFICKMEQFFEDDQSFIFVLQYLSGKDLMTLYREKAQIGLPVLISIFKGVLQSLAYIHSKNIMHRDLKPQNIMIDESTMTPKLIDFGLSLLYGPKTDKKRFKRCGTMGYMAHEVITNSADKKKAYDCKCDMFSFGIIVHMMLLGYNPLKGKNYNETVKKNQQCNIQLEKDTILQKYGKYCYDFLFGLLQKDPTKRLSAEEALGSQFMNQQFLGQSKAMKAQTEQKQNIQKQQDEAQFEYEDQQVKIPSFQIFTPKSINLQNRA